MPQFDKIVQRAAENLYGDERLRSNLTDGEAKIVLDWAVKWIGEQVNAARDEPTAQQIAQTELARVRQTATALNALAIKPGALRLADAVAALAAGVQTAQALPREQVFALATQFASALWKLQTTKK